MTSRPIDRSRWFIEQIEEVSSSLTPTVTKLKSTPDLFRTRRQYLNHLKAEHGIEDENFVKPGIGEATRVLLRRTPALVILRDLTDPDTEHLRVLAEEKNVPVEQDSATPYKAVSLIRRPRMTSTIRANDALALGASLYVPATHPDLVMVGRGQKFPLRSLIYCTEDAVGLRDLPYALRNLARTLNDLSLDDFGGEPAPMRFVRVRNSEVMRHVMQMNTSALHGLVLPKVAAENLNEYLDLLPFDSRLSLMLTLETQEVFSDLSMTRLRDRLLEPHTKNRVLSLRIGGNDLLNLLSLRRERGVLLYDTPLAHAVDRLVTLFKPFGFNLSAPVYDAVNDPMTLTRETQLDLQHGLFGKTAIHPEQIPVIEACYKVSPQAWETAQAILEADAPAVFLRNGRLCEPSTHRRWAEQIVQRAAHYGLEVTPLGAEEPRREFVPINAL